MRPSSRFAACAAGLLLLQLAMTLGTAFACAMPGMGHAAGDSAMSTAMSMMSMPMARASSVTVAPARSQTVRADDASTTPEMPCRLPWAPADCHGTVPCAPAAITSTALALLPAPLAAHDVPRLAVLAPAARGTPPEPPPPRA